MKLELQSTKGLIAWLQHEGIEFEHRPHEKMIIINCDLSEVFNMGRSFEKFLNTYAKENL